MPKSISVLKRSLLVGTACMLVGGLVPVGAYADDPSSPTCTPPSSQSGVHHPVGADAATYTYDCNTGLWENGYYAYDPATGKTTPTYAVTYTYNAKTGLYDYPVWIFNAPHNNFVQISQSAATPPAGATVIGGPAPVTPPANNGGSPAGNSNPAGGSISNTGPDSTNAIDGATNNDLTVNNQNNLSVTNTIGQQSASGNALVMGNTTGGNATSGNAINSTLLMNNLQSTTNALAGNAVTFVANINGDVNGDLLFDPAGLSNIQNAGPNSTNTLNSTANNNLVVNNSNNGSITNNLNLAANSGNATVSDNTKGGNATSGNAENIAEIVNTVDSMITAGQSFIGTININGNLNGNILLPANLVDQLLAANVPTVTLTGPNSTNTGSTTVNNNATVNNTNNQNISNNVTASAASGNATVSHNTTGGSAASGSATNDVKTGNTTITAFNLTGSQVLGSNDILVFVNVTGQWIGLIVGAPAGTTAAEFGGGITNTGPNSTNSTNSTVNNNATVNNTNNSQITNNLNLNAQSGNATVSDNTTGGNAKSGDAKNAVDILNTEGSNLNLSGWFGILFINVFGSWHGNFGTEPSPGDSLAGTVGSTTTTTGPKNSSLVPTTMKVFGFVSHNGNTNTFSAGNTSGSNTTGTPSTTGTVLAAKHSNSTTPQLQNVGHRNYFLPAASVLLFLVYIAFDRAYSVRRRQAKAAARTSANIQAQAL